MFVRSPHATIKRINTQRAEAMPGVAKVFTGKDIEGKMGGCPAAG